MRSRLKMVIFIGMLLFGVGPALGEDGARLLWKPGRVVDASIQEQPIRTVLGQIAGMTGWKVYVEPGLDYTISVSFQSQPEGDALRMLLRKVNYALVREQAGPSKLYVYQSTLGGATDLVEPEVGEKPSGWLANEIIVRLEPGSREDMEKLAESLGGKVVASSDELNAYRLQFKDAETAQAAREKLAARNDLEVSDNYEFQRPVDASQGFANNPLAFGIDPAPVAAGDQIRVAVVDTAVQPLEGKMKDFVLPSIDVVEGGGGDENSPSHGTSMVQTLLNSMARMDRENLAGKVRVQPVDIYGVNESTTTFEVAMGLQAAIQQNPHIINMSLGGEGFSPLVEQLVQIAYEKQIMMFASAGNSPTTLPTYPAASPYAIAVTAAMPDGSVAPYANRGDFVDVKAPGTSLVRYNGQNFVSTGTSTATAFTSGFAAALVAQGMSTRDVANMMLTGVGLEAATLGTGRPKGN